MSNLKPIKLYGHASGPNPWKVAMILEELNVPYETEYIDMKVIKQEPFISVNPNGRVPAIEDPNTGLTLWESGAILEYLISQYDTTQKISYTTLAESNHTRQWLYFQVSGQGPYYGQFVWFMRFHPEKVPSAVERYKNEAIRVVGVINAHLERTGQQYLVGDKCTYADIAFVPWAAVLRFFEDELYADGKNKAHKEWLERVMAREAVKKVLAEKEEKAKEGH